MPSTIVARQRNLRPGAFRSGAAATPRSMTTEHPRQDEDVTHQDRFRHQDQTCHTRPSCPQPRNRTPSERPPAPVRGASPPRNRIASRSLARYAIRQRQQVKLGAQLPLKRGWTLILTRMRVQPPRLTEQIVRVDRTVRADSPDTPFAAPVMASPGAPRAASPSPTLRNAEETLTSNSPPPDSFDIFLHLRGHLP